MDDITFTSLDAAIAAVPATVTLSVVEWEDGFTWEIFVVRPKSGSGGKYEDFTWSYEGDDPFESASNAGIDACKHAIERLGAIDG